MNLNDLMTEHKPNYLILIPTMYYAMLVSKNFNIDNFKEVEFLVQGGSAPLAGVLRQEVRIHPALRTQPL